MGLVGRPKQKSIEKISAKNGNDVETLISFIIKGDRELTSKQHEFLQRLQFADMLIKERKWTREEVVQMNQEKFNTSKWRADQDITDCHKVFGSTRKINKNYLMAHHLDEIEKHIQLAKEKGRLDLLAKLNDNYTYALNSIPSDAKDFAETPANIVFVINNETMKQDKSVEDLLAEVDQLINQVPEEDYLEYDEPNENL